MAIEERGLLPERFTLRSRPAFDLRAYVRGLKADGKGNDQTLKTVTEYVSKRIEATDGEGQSERIELQNRCYHGDPAAARKMQDLILDIIRRDGLFVPGYEAEALGKKIYDYLYGLDVLSDLYEDPAVDEVRVNRWDWIASVRRVSAARTSLRLKDDYNVGKILERIGIPNGSHATKSHPVVKFTRLDGSRVTGLQPPLSKHTTMILRKHGTFALTEESLVESRTLSPKILGFLSVLMRARIPVILSGTAFSGKTSLLRFLVRYIDPSLRIVTLETSFELNLDEAYPDRDIVPLKEVPEADLPLSKVFPYVLQLSPGVIIVGEVLGSEAKQALKAATRGHGFTMATVHVTRPALVVRELIEMLYEDSATTPISLVWDAHRIADTFPIVLQMRGDSAKGRIIVTEVAELRPTADGVEAVPLIRWRFEPGHYWEGDWEMVEEPSKTILDRALEFDVVPEEILQLWRE